MKRNIIIVDDFYPNPDIIRNTALNADYSKEDGRNWPGRDSIEEFLHTDIKTVISDIVGTPVKTSPNNKCGHFRMTKEHEKGKQHIHFDPNPNLIWAGVLYLTPNIPKNSGTKFWKHKEYGWEQSPHMEEAEKRGVNNFNDMLNFFNTEGNDESKWDEVLNVTPKYNRLVLFNPWLFHSGGVPFGKYDHDCRLVQLFFFHDLFESER